MPIPISRLEGKAKERTKIAEKAVSDFRKSRRWRTRAPLWRSCRRAGREKSMKRSSPPPITARR